MMASDMDKFLEMSLDEYIATKKNSVRSNDSKNVSNSIGAGFKAGRSNSKTIDLNDKDEVMENDVDVLGEMSLMKTSDKLNKSFGIWRGPSAETTYIDLDYMKDEFDEMFNDPELKISSEDKQMKQNRPKDLRERLNSNANASNNINTNCNNNNKVHEHTISTVNRNNWRTNMQTQQNSVSLMSLNTDCGPSGNGQFRRRWNNNNNRNFRRRNNDGCSGNRGNGHPNSGVQNMNWNNNRNNGGSPNSNALSMNNNGRIQRFSQRNSQDNLNKRIKTVLDQINGNSSILLNKQPGTVRDLTIECPSVSISGRLTSGALQTAAKQNLQLPATQTQSDLKALLGVNENNLKADTMAMWAGKLLELFQSTQQQTVHKPIYDMQIQKEIHDLQGKSLLYKCPSGEVVSSDGSGIDNCKITPSSSGVTLNYRFG